MRCMPQTVLKGKTGHIISGFSVEEPFALLSRLLSNADKHN
jgi:hypothetical protein